MSRRPRRRRGDPRREALAGPGAARRDRPELPGLREEALRQAPPPADLPAVRPRRRPAPPRRDHRLRPAFRQVLEQPVRAGRPVAGEGPERQAAGKPRHPIGPCAWPGRSVKRTGHPGASATATALLVRPPRERPVPWPEVPLLRPPPSGSPGPPCRRRTRAGGRTPRTRRRNRARRPPEAAGAGTA